MLIIKEQMSLQSLRGIHLTPAVLNDRIGVLYNVMNLDISAEDFLHLISNPPGIYLAEGQNMNVSIQNNVYNQKLKMQMMNQMINQLLLLQNDAFTYQDTVYVTAMLEKLGIKRVNELLQDIRQIISETKNIQKLTELYWYNGESIKQRIEDTKEQENSKETTVWGKQDEEIEQKRCYLHTDIYHRLETAIIYNDVYEQIKQYGAVSETINQMELGMAEQVRVSGALLLSELRKEYVFPEHKSIEFHINQYEAGITEQKELTRKNILSNLVSAVLVSLTDNIYQIRNEQIEQPSVQYKIVQALYRSMDNTVKRYEIYHTQEIPGFIKRFDYSDNINQLYRYEIELLEEVSADNSEIMTEIYNKEPQSKYWEQELIYYIQQNKEYDLSKEHNQTLMELAVNYLSFQQKLQYIQHQLTENRISSGVRMIYQDILNEIKQIKEESLTEEKRLLVNDIMTEVIKQYQESDVKSAEKTRKTTEKQRERINEILNIHNFMELFQERFLFRNDSVYETKLYEKINDLKYRYIRQKLKQINHNFSWISMSEIDDEITIINNKVEKKITDEISVLKNTLAHSVSIRQPEYEKQNVNDLDTIYIQNNSQGDTDEFHIQVSNESIENQENNTVYLGENNTDREEMDNKETDNNKTIIVKPELNETVQDLISRETMQVLQPSLTRIAMESQDIVFQNKNIRNETDIYIGEKEAEISEKWFGYDMPADTGFERPESNISNQWKNQTFLQELQEINQKNIEMNQKYLQQKSDKQNTYSTFQIDGKKTINEALKMIHNPADQRIENQEYKNTVLKPEIIDERIRSLASNETIQIFETILGSSYGEKEPFEQHYLKAEEEKDRKIDGSSLMSNDFQQEKQEKKNSRIVVHKSSETELLSELHRLEQQIKYSLENEYPLESRKILNPMENDLLAERKQQIEYRMKDLDIRNQTQEYIRENSKIVYETPETGQRLPDAIQSEADKVMKLIHKESGNHIEEEILEQFMNRKRAVQQQESHTQEIITNYMVETKEIQQQKKEVIHRSEEELSKLVQKNLQRQMEVITDKVFNRIEKKLQLEKRRHGY